MKKTLLFLTLLLASYSLVLAQDPIPISEARMAAEDETVTVEGIALNGGEFFRIRYIQDETGAIALYDGGNSLEGIKTGDRVRATGSIVNFRNLLEVSNIGENFTIISSGNDLPEPKVLAASEGFAEAYEANLLQFENMQFVDSGEFGTNSANYTITDEAGNEYQVRVNQDTDIVGTAIPTGKVTITGILGQFDDTYQLLPRSIADIEGDGGTVDPPPTGNITPIADARLLLEDTEVTVKGIALHGSEFFRIRYIQDETGAVPLYDQNNSMESVQEGDSIVATGLVTDFRGLLEISNIGENFTIINSGNPSPEPTILDPTVGFSEDYEANLVRFENMRFLEIGNFGDASANYTITDGENEYQVRVNQDTDISNTPIPSGAMNITGLMGQFDDTYQLLPRGLKDLEFLGNPPVFGNAPQQTNLATTSFTVEYETLNPGTTILNYGTTTDLELGTLENGDFTTTHSTDLTDLTPGSIYYIQAISISETGDSSISAIQPMATVSLSSGEIEVYFNQPVNTDVATEEDAIFLDLGFDDTIKAYISRAKHSIDMCIYNIDEENGIITRLQEAHDRGVRTRFVVDQEVRADFFDELPGNEKIKSPSGSQYGLMHNKFIIIDADSDEPNDPFVLSGSTNFTNGQLKSDPNNIIIFQDQSLARGFKLEFEEMLNGDFGVDKKNNTPKEYLVGGNPVQAYFSPSDFTNTVIKNAIRSAETDLYFAVFAWSARRVDFAFEIESRIQDNVFVAGIMDPSSDIEPYDILIDDAKCSIVRDNVPGIFHHKYMIVDPNNTGSDPLVLTGSHNWSNNAQFRSDENIVVVHNARVANLYFQEFVQRYLDNGFSVLMDSTCVVGVEDANATQADLRVFPNPVTSLLQVRYTAPKIDALNISISNITGQILERQQINAYQANQKINLPINHLPKGIYFLRVNDTVQKFMIAE